LIHQVVLRLLVRKSRAELRFVRFEITTATLQKKIKFNLILIHSSSHTVPTHPRTPDDADDDDAPVDAAIDADDDVRRLSRDGYRRVRAV
jgi:hypothetical protein